MYSRRGLLQAGLCAPFAHAAGSPAVLYHAAAAVPLSPPVPIRGFQNLRLTWRERWNMPAVWHKHEQNPVLSPASAPAWDAGSLTTPCVVERGAAFRLYYGSRPKGIGVAVARDSEMHGWKRREAPVLTAGPSGAFDGGGVNAPEVVPITDKHWRMYYVGYHPTAKTGGTAVHQIGLAESNDGGWTWRRVSNDPVIPRGRDGSYDAFSTSSASVLRVGNEWWLWYGGIAQVPYLASICLAISTDGVMFRKYEANPVLQFNPHLEGEAFMCAKPHVLFEHGVFRMWYTARGFGEGRKPGDYRVCYAESLDGIHWERYSGNPVLGPSRTGWDRRMVEYAEVLRAGDVYHMWYCGDGYESVGYASGQGSELKVQTRSGPTRTPDDAWSDWSAPHRQASEGPLAVGGNFLQIRVTRGPADVAAVQGLMLTGERT